MKKAIILTISAILGVFAASSCGKMLDVAPPNNITDEQISNLMLNGSEETKAKILAQIATGIQQYFNVWAIPNVGTGALAPSTYCMQGIEWMRGLQGNDICIGRDANTNGLCGKAFYEGTFNFRLSNESTNKAHWYVNAHIINKANFILGYMTKEMAAKNASYANARAAALMVRGYGYMCLMEEYTPTYTKISDPNAPKSGMPIYKEYSPGQDPVVPSTAKETWDFIKEDLKEAVTLTQSYGITTGWTNLEDLDFGLANFLYARACLLCGDWSECISACNTLVNSGKYSFIKQANWGGHNTGASWDADDVEVLPETNAFTALNVNPECILGFNVKSSYNPHSESAIAAHHTRLANPFGTYASSTCARIDDRLYNKIADNDFRKDGWYPEEIVNFKYLGQTPATVASYCAMKFGATYGLSETDGLSHTSKDAAVGINDFCKFRYSEVVLMLAEAYAQSGNDGQAKATLNTLLAARTRSGAATLTCDNYPGMSGLSALQMVQLQYRIEMWGENGREFYNNKRWGINVDRSGSAVHVKRDYTLDANTMVCEIIEEELRNNSNW